MREYQAVCGVTSKEGKVCFSLGWIYISVGISYESVFVYLCNINR